jgi:hypothetical protein
LPLFAVGVPFLFCVVAGAGRVNSNPGRKSDDTHNNEKIEATLQKFRLQPQKIQGAEFNYFDRNAIFSNPELVINNENILKIE